MDAQLFGGGNDWQYDKGFFTVKKDGITTVVAKVKSSQYEPLVAELIRTGNLTYGNSDVTSDITSLVHKLIVHLD